MPILYQAAAILHLLLEGKHIRSSICNARGGGFKIEKGDILTVRCQLWRLLI